MGTKERSNVLCKALVYGGGGGHRKMGSKEMHGHVVMLTESSSRSSVQYISRGRRKGVVYSTLAEREGEGKG